MADPKIESNLLDNLKRNALILLIVPLVLIGVINITYGEYYDAIIGLQYLEQTSIFQLHNQLRIFKNDIPLSIGRLPLVVRDIGYYSVLVIYIFLVVWIVTFSISNYLKLIYRKGYKILMLLELLFMVVVFTYSVKPGMGLIFSMLGYLIFFMFLTILLFYWLEEIRNR